MLIQIGAVRSVLGCSRQAQLLLLPQHTTFLRTFSCSGRFSPAQCDSLEIAPTLTPSRLPTVLTIITRTRRHRFGSRSYLQERPSLVQRAVQCARRHFTKTSSAEGPPRIYHSTDYRVQLPSTHIQTSQQLSPRCIDAPEFRLIGIPAEPPWPGAFRHVLH